MPTRTTSSGVGSDALLLLGLLNVVFGEGLDRPDRLVDFTDGLAALREIKRSLPDTVVIVFTAYGSPDVLELKEVKYIKEIVVTLGPATEERNSGLHGSSYLRFLRRRA